MQFTATNHYPFGMVMPGTDYSDPAYTGGYRYGFNGKEMDNEVSGSGNQYDYGFRIYNPRLGKFLSVDPLTSSYPWYTPYQFAGNTPIQAIDLDGLEQTYSYYITLKSAGYSIELKSVEVMPYIASNPDVHGDLGDGHLTINVEIEQGDNGWYQYTRSTTYIEYDPVTDSYSERTEVVKKKFRIKTKKVETGKPWFSCTGKKEKNVPGGIAWVSEEGGHPDSDLNKAADEVDHMDDIDAGIPFGGGYWYRATKSFEEAKEKLEDSDTERAKDEDENSDDTTPTAKPGEALSKPGKARPPIIVDQEGIPKDDSTYYSIDHTKNPPDTTIRKYDENND